MREQRGSLYQREREIWCAGGEGVNKIIIGESPRDKIIVKIKMSEREKKK